MSAPERMVFQPCPVLGWDNPDRVKYVIAPGAEYVCADLLTAMTAERDALMTALRVMGDPSNKWNALHYKRAILALIDKGATND